jgi:hypothetical protein
MIKTAEDGLNRYLKELKKYRRWINIRKKVSAALNDDLDPSDIPLAIRLDDSEYALLKSWQIKLRAMQEVLNIANKENEGILEETEYMPPPSSGDKRRILQIIAQCDTCNGTGIRPLLGGGPTWGICKNCNGAGKETKTLEFTPFISRRFQEGAHFVCESEGFEILGELVNYADFLNGELPKITYLKKSTK